MVNHPNRSLRVKEGYTYCRKFAAWLGDEIVTIPDQIADDQRDWDRRGNGAFYAIRANGRRVGVRLDPEAYDLHGSGTGDCCVKRA